jgi:LuxR family transcriptional regulator, maltose regulon positive regulatory protein
MRQDETRAIEAGADAVASGWAALRRGAWEQARACFARALAVQESAAALEGLGMTAWWLDEAATTAEARERAYGLYRQADDWRAAARLATWLAWDALSFRGEPAVANGWLQRGYRLLDGRNPVPEHGWLLLRDAEIRLLHAHDTQAAKRLAAQAVTWGRAWASWTWRWSGWRWRRWRWSARARWPRGWVGWTRPRRRPPAGSLVT